MSRNRIQFQIGLSLPEFNDLYGNESNCREELIKHRWPDGYCCAQCAHTDFCRFERGRRLMFECKKCSHQCSLISGTLFENTHLPLTLWFMAFYLISQSKNCVSSLELHRHLGINYKSAWLMKHKIMQMMYDGDLEYKLRGRIEVDDAYLGGKLEGGGSGRGSKNKSAFIAAIQTDQDKHPLYARFTPLPAFSSAAVKEWAGGNITPGAHTVTDGLACFKVLEEFGTHEVHVVSKEGYEKTDLHFKWVNTVLSNVKTSLSGTFHSLNFKKYGYRYLADLQFRFNRRFDLIKLFHCLTRRAVCHGPIARKILETAESG